jgi:hypothetical protein
MGNDHHHQLRRPPFSQGGEIAAEAAQWAKCRARNGRKRPQAVRGPQPARCERALSGRPEHLQLCRLPVHPAPRLPSSRDACGASRRPAAHGWPEPSEPDARRARRWAARAHLSKFGVSTRAAATVLALQNGLVADPLDHALGGYRPIMGWMAHEIRAARRGVEA